MYVLCLREDRDRSNDIEPCGSELARDGDGSVDIYVECADAIASKLAPTEEQSGSAYTHAPHHSTGRALARLPLLILIHPPPRQAEWRCSSGEWRVAPFDAVELIACRSREADRRAMPPDEYRSEGTPSLSEGPDVRGETFGSFGAFAKGTRRKGETTSRHNPKNGSVHNQEGISKATDIN